MNKLTAIVPFYNEEATIQNSIENLLKVSQISQVILVDDCSTDSSLKIAKAFLKRNNEILILQTTKNAGKGAAVRVALNSVNSEYVIVHDADLEYNPQDILPMLKVVENNKNIDVVLGSRFIGNKTRRNIYLRTFFANKFLSLLFSILNRRKVTDVATCYKLIKSEIYQNIELTKNGFEYEIEILSKALEYSSDFAEVPIDYNARTYQEGKKIKFSDGFKYILCIFKYRIKN
tara:strand:- start:5534 stop:6229 length:696 start_codon:yes stop_codon:yes gene_type:complete